MTIKDSSRVDDDDDDDGNNNNNNNNKSLETSSEGKVTIVCNQQVQTDRTIPNDKLDHLISKPTNAHTYIFFTLKHLKFLQHVSIFLDHPQGVLWQHVM